jgi:hypothetical protein
MSNTKQEPEKPKTPQGLRGKSYAALFRSDVKPERVAFEVAGKPCWVELRRMGKDDRNEFLRVSGGLQNAENADLLKATEYLVAHTVVGYQFWTRPQLADGSLGEWQQLAPPEGTTDLLGHLRDNLDFLPDLWDDLCVECSRVNGFTEDAAGN